MKKGAIAFLSAMTISSIGALPLGTLNVMAMNLSIAHGTTSGMLFTLGVLLVEMAYVAITVSMLKKLLAKPRLMHLARVISILVMLSLSAWYLIPHTSATTAMNDTPLISSSLVLGLTMSALNPAQVPFWLGWTTIAIDKKLLEQQNKYTLIWVFGVGMGTLAGLSAFVWGGKKLMDLSGVGKHMDVLIGIIFLLTALWQLITLLKKR